MSHPSFHLQNFRRGVVLLALLMTLAATAPGQHRLNTPQTVPSWASGPNDTEVPTQLCMDTANFLGGIKGRADGPFHALEDTAAWKAYADQWDKTWEHAKAKQFDAVDSFQKRELSSIKSGSNYMFYPFSGPDILYAQHFFPNARLSIFVAREDLGDIHAPDFYTTANIAHELEGWRQGVASIFDRTFFVTSEMDQQFHGEVSNGILPLMLIFLVRNGNVLDYVRYGKITDDGDFVPESILSPRHHAIEIHYREPAETQSRILYYVYADLAGPYAKDPSLSKFLAKQGRADTFIKSASFLLHWQQFAAIRKTILENSNLILQDDTGVPFKMLNPKEWQVELFGTYSHPDKPFVNQWQPDLDTAFKEPGRAKTLGFVLGYGSHRRPSSLMLALRQPPAAPQPANNR